MKQTIIGLFVLSVLSLSVNAQYETPVQYLEALTKTSEKVSSVYLGYLSAMGHNKNARKIEKRRQEVLETIQNTRSDVQGMPPWKGDRSYKDSTVAYYKLMYNVFNEDYAKIVDMEDIAEQSYDAMEAYMLAKERANNKLSEAADRQMKMEKDFAAKNNINLLEGASSPLQEKAKIANALMDHYGTIYLIFFKAYKQEAYLLDAVSKKNVTAIEQNRSALQTIATEGLQQLQSARGYSNDPALIGACRQALQFYKNEAGQMDYASEFLLQTEVFESIKKGIDGKPASKRTQQDVNEYNVGVNNFNKAVSKYNTTNSKMDQQRQQSLNNWNNTVSQYLDQYMPKYKA